MSNSRFCSVCQIDGHAAPYIPGHSHCAFCEDDSAAECVCDYSGTQPAVEPITIWGPEFR